MRKPSAFLLVLSSLLLGLIPVWTTAQCPQITNLTVTPPSGNELCPGDQVNFLLDGIDLPQGTIDWYINPDNPNFNPYLGDGSFIGSSFITPDESEISICDPCPELVALMIDACNGNSGNGNEYDNEFLIISSGGGISSADQIQIDLEDGNNYEPGGTNVNNDINYQANPCGFLNSPNPGLLNALRSSANCNASNIVGIGPNSPIPAGALVVVFTSNNTDVNYNFDELCASGEVVYILQSNCSRTRGAFTNGNGSSDCKTYRVFIGDCPQCTSQIAYNTGNVPNLGSVSLGSYVYNFDANGNGMIDYNGGCNSSEVIHSIGVPCQAPPVESIPISPIPATVSPFLYTIPLDACGNGGEQTYYITGIINPLYEEGCVDGVFQPDYSPYLTDTYMYTVNCTEPELLSPPELCIGQSYTLDDLVVDINQYNLSGWANDAGTPIDVFVPSQEGTFTYNFFPIGNGGTCYGPSSATFTVVDGVSPVLGTASLCQNETAYDLSQLEDPNFTDGIWTLNGTTLTDDEFDASSFMGDVELTFEPDASTNTCLVPVSTTITVSSGPTLDVQVSNALGCTDNVATLSTGTTDTDLTYAWSGLGIDATNENEESPSISIAGTYAVTVTNTAGCSTISSVEVMQNATNLPDIDATVSGTISCNVTSVELDGISTAATSFSWEGPDGTIYNEENPMVSDSGTYILTVEDATGCSATTSLQVALDTIAPEIGIDLSNDLTCIDTQADLTATATDLSVFTDFEWVLEMASVGNTANISTTDGGMFTLLVTDVNGCTNSESITVVIDTLSPEVTIDAVTDPITCAEPEVFLSATSTSSMVSYTWTTPSGGTIIGSSPPAIEAGTYTVVVGGFNGCTSSASVEVEAMIVQPTVVLTPSTLDCASSMGMIETMSTDNITDYQWIGPGTYSSTDSTPTDITQTGTYTVTITDANGCTNTASTIVSADSSVPTVDIATPDGLNVGCSNSDLVLVGSTEMGNTIEWTNPDGTTSSDLTNMAGEAGTYTLLVTAANGCTNSQTVQVISNTSMPLVSLSLTSVLDCNSDGVLEVFTNAPAVEWTLPNGTTATDLSITAAEEGTYTLVATNANGCTTQETYTLVGNVVEPDIATITSEDFSCLQMQADLTASTSVSNAQFDWTTPSGQILQGADQTVLEQGTYTLTITDMVNGCTATASTTVSSVTTPPNVLTSDVVLDCNGSDLTLSATANETVTYEWTDPNGNFYSDSANPTVSSVGVYTVIVTSAATGCINTATANVTGSTDLPDLAIDVSNDFDCVNSDALITASTTIDNPVFEWTNELGVLLSNDSTYLTTATGMFTVVVTDADNNCTTTTTAQVNTDTAVPDIAVATAQGTTLTCLQTNIELSASSTTADVSYEWTNPDNTTNPNPTINPTTMGDYTLVITNPANGCTATTTTSVTGSTTPPVLSTADVALDCVSGMTTLSSTVDDTVSYEWTDANGVFYSDMANPSVSETGDYTLVVTSTTTGCTNTAVASVTGTVDLPDVAIDVSNELNCVNTNAVLTAMTTVSNPSYEWTDADGNIVSNEMAFANAVENTYTLLITNQDNDCSNTTSWVLIADTTVPDIALDTIGGTLLTCAQTSVELAATSMTEGVGFEWTNPANSTFTDDSIYPTIVGDYTLVVTNPENGCTSSVTTNITENTTPPTIIPQDVELNCDGESFFLTASIDEEVTYVWLAEDGSFYSDGVGPPVWELGDYTLVATSTTTGCTSTEVVAVTGPQDIPDVGIDVNNNFTCVDNGAVLTGSTMVNNPVYEWTDADGNVVSEDVSYDVTTVGNYTLTITNLVESCSSSLMVSVFPDTLTPNIGVATAQGTNLTCVQTSVELGATSSIPDLTYEWTNPDNSTTNNATIYPTVAGEYALFATNPANGCTATTTATVVENTTPPTVSTEDVALDCSSVIFTLDATTNESVTYTWLDENGDLYSTFPTPSVSDMGVFDLIVTSTTTGCTSTTSTTVTSLMELPDITVDASDTLTCINNDAVLTASTTIANPLYEWIDISGNVLSNDLTFPITLGGAYSLLITDLDNSCTNGTTMIITPDTQSPDIAVATLDGTDLTCVLSSVELVASSMTPDVSYQWTNPDNTTIANATTNATEIGAYTLFVTDPANGCTATSITTIFENTTPPAVFTEDVALGCDSTAYFLNVSVDEFVAYEWLDENGDFYSDMENPFVTAAGIYDLVVTSNTTGCTSTASTTVTTDTGVPDAVINVSNDLDCMNNSAVLTASTTVSNPFYLWTDENAVPLSNGITYSASATGTYLLTITNLDNNCSTIEMTEVVADTLSPTVSLASSNTIDCFNTSAELTATSMITNPNYEWIDSSGMIVSTEANFTATDAGEFMLQLTDLDNGCSNTEMFVLLDESEVPMLEIQTQNNLLDCDNGMVILTANSDATNPNYEWLDENGVAISTLNEITVSESGLYTLVVQNGACTNQTDLMVLEETSPPDVLIEITSTENIIDCNTESIELTGTTSEMVSYNWTGPNGFVATTATIDALEEGDYTLTVTSMTTGCTTEQLTTVFDDFAPPSITAFGGVLNCAAESLVLAGSSSIPTATFEWTGENNFTSIEANPEVSAAGLYTLTVTSPSNGCTATESVEVSLDESFPSLEASIEPLTCNQQMSVLDGSLSTPPGDSIIYQWFFNGQSLGMSELVVDSIETTGTYTLLGTNITNLCIDSIMIELTENATPPMAVAGDDDVLTCVETSLQLDASNSAGQGDLTYVWVTFSGDTLSTDAQVEIDSAMPYTVIVTDANNGCTASDEVMVIDNTLSPLSSILPYGVIDCNTTNIEVASETSFFGADYAYQWLDNTGILLGTDSVQVFTAGGAYSLVITNNDNGCTDEQTLTIAQDNTPPSIAISEPMNLDCNNETVIIEASNTSGGTNFFSWTGPAGATIMNMTTLTPTVDMAGIYELTIANLMNGCTASDSVEVEIDETLPDAVASVVQAFDCNTSQIQLLGTGSSEGDFYEYLWTGPSIVSDTNSLNITINQSGVYNFLVTNTENGCTNTDMLTIPEGTIGISTSDVLVEEEDCFGDNNALIQVSAVEGGTAPYLYSLNGSPFSQNTQYGNLSPGIYDLQIEDADGCEWAETLTIVGATPLNVDLGDNLVIQLGDIVDLDIGTALDVDSITWSQVDLEGTNPSFMPTNATTVEVTVIDENGCTATDAISIFIEKDRSVYIPNAFSPNGDGTNDVLTILADGAVANVKVFQIYDRFGELIFSATDFQANDAMYAWDGRFRGKTLDPAVFVYYAEIEFTDGIVEFYKGDITLMR